MWAAPPHTLVSGEPPHELGRRNGAMCVRKDAAAVGGEEVDAGGAAHVVDAQELRQQRLRAHDHGKGTQDLRRERALDDAHRHVGVELREVAHARLRARTANVGGGEVVLEGGRGGRPAHDGWPT